MCQVCSQNVSSKSSLFILSQISSIFFLDHKIMTELGGKRQVFVQVGMEE